ncbi:MAG: hypothetical protein JSW00_02230 [Thermoplasmata archaeon]|nr:MAG: hypothetical protein JSW00_02230 [Thermoplasmata archaeon]
MGDFNAIRGRAPTKTELILEYLVKHADEVLTPKEVAKDLGFNLQTTVTVLNRLALEGAISKIGRGQFLFRERVERKLPKATTESEKKDDLIAAVKIDSKTASTIYKAIYSMASESTGDVIGSLTGVGPDDFDEKAPIESIQNLVRALIEILGKEIADDIVSIALDSEIKGEGKLELKELL